MSLAAQLVRREPLFADFKFSPPLGLPIQRGIVIQEVRKRIPRLVARDLINLMQNLKYINF